MDMEYDVKSEARKQYVKYFRVWFILFAVIFVVFGIRLVGTLLKKEAVVERTNKNAPKERVFDDAKVLSDSEEDKLRKLIAEVEAEIHCDIVLWTINQPVEGAEAQAEYGYRYDDWELNMRDLADDYFDYNGFGYDNVDFSGALLLDNCYEGQEGTWLSTTGAVYEKFGNAEIDYVLDEVYYTLVADESAYYTAYKKGIEEIRIQMQDDKLGAIFTMGMFVVAALFIPIIVALIFILIHLKSKEGDITTTVNTYVNGDAQMNRRSDAFIRKTETTRRIETSSSGGGSRSSSSGGRGGSHRSSSGRSHGGGGRRR